jgi:rod shape-determining protein MreC
VARPQRTDPKVDLALVAGCAMLAGLCLVVPGKTRDRVAAALRTTIVAPAAALQARAELSRRSFMAEAVTRRMNDSVSLRSQRLTGVEDENIRLRQLLGLSSTVQWGFVPAEILQGRLLGDEFTVTLSAGARAGVELLSPIIVSDGLVGVVQRADPSLSVAILWPHPDFRVSAMSADGATYGIVTSHVGPSADRYLLELRSVPLRTQLRPGTLIVSSGAGGVFPRNIPVGTVINELKTSDAWARTYLLRPAVKFADLGAVMVLTRARSTKGVDGIWNIESLADSARRSVVAAGDSLTARLRDSAVAALRQRAADSIAAVVALGGRAEAVLAKPALGKPRSTP